MADADRYVPAAGRQFLTRFYDLGLKLTMREEAWRPLMVETAVQAQPSVILDLGCGTGALAIPLAERSGARVVGVDGDPKVLAIASGKPGADRVEWTESLASRLPLADGEVDCLVSSLVFHHLPLTIKREALAEAKRVLRPGGQLLIADWGAPQDALMSAAFFGLQCLDGFTTTGDNRRGQIPELIEEAGFDPVRRLQRIRTVCGTFEVLASASPGNTR